MRFPRHITRRARVSIDFSSVFSWAETLRFLPVPAGVTPPRNQTSFIITGSSKCNGGLRASDIVS